MSWAPGRSSLPTATRHIDIKNTHFSSASKSSVGLDNNNPSTPTSSVSHTHSPPKLPKGIRKLVPFAAGSSVSPKKSNNRRSIFTTSGPGGYNRQVTFLIQDNSKKLEEVKLQQNSESTYSDCPVPEVINLQKSTTTNSLSPFLELCRIREQKALLRQQFFNQSSSEIMPVTKETVSSAAHSNKTSSSSGIPKLYSVVTHTHSQQSTNNKPIVQVQPQLPCPTISVPLPNKSGTSGNINVRNGVGGPSPKRKIYAFPALTTLTTSTTTRIPQGGIRSSGNNILRKPEPTTPFYMLGLQRNPVPHTGLVQERTKYWQNRTAAGTGVGIPQSTYRRVGTGTGSTSSISTTSTNTKRTENKSITVNNNISNNNRSRSPSIGIRSSPGGTSRSPSYQTNKTSELRRRRNSVSPTPTPPLPPHDTGGNHEFLDDEISDQPGLLIGAHTHTVPNFTETDSKLLPCSTSTSASVSLSSSVSSLDKDKSISPKGSRSYPSSSVPSCRDTDSTDPEPETEEDEKTISSLLPIPTQSKSSNLNKSYNIQQNISKFEELPKKSSLSLESYNAILLPEITSLHTDLILLKETLEIQEQTLQEKDSTIYELQKENQELRNTIHGICLRLGAIEGHGIPQTNSSAITNGLIGTDVSTIGHDDKIF